MPAPTLVGGLVRVNVPNFASAGDQNLPTIAATATGRLVVAWGSVNQYEVAVMRADGITEGASTTYILANGIAGSFGSQIDAAGLSDGRVVLAWHSNAVDASGDINFAFVDEINGISSLTTIALAGVQLDPVVAEGIGGRFAMLFAGQGTATDVFRASYNRYGSAILTPEEITVGFTVAGDQVQPNIAALQDGRFISVWSDVQSGALRGVILQTDGGRPGGTPLTLSTALPQFAGPGSGHDDIFAVAALANGGFAISYSPSNTSVVYQLFDANGAPTSTAQTLTTIGGFGQTALGLPDGRLVLASSGPTGDIRGQMVNADGTLDGAAFIIDNAAGNQFYPSLALLPDGRFAVAYMSENLTGGSGRDIAMKIFDPREAAILVGGTQDADDIYGTGFNDSIGGGEGADTLQGAGGADLMSGGLGNDSLLGGDGADTIYGDGGADTIRGDIGADIILGGAGNDTLEGGAGNDTLDGGAGTDTANYADRALAVAINPFINTAAVTGGELDTISNIENFTGGSGNDTIQGTFGVNAISGGGGNDLIYAFDGADLVDGGAGNDVIAGGIGDDTITGGDGGDWLYGEDGNDNLSGTAKSGGAFDVIVGGNGNDTLEGSGGGFDYFYGGVGVNGATGDGNDTYIVRAATGIKVMNDFEVGGTADVIRLLGTGFTTFAQVQAAMSFFGTINGTVLVVDGTTQIWFLNGTQPASLTAADFAFV